MSTETKASNALVATVDFYSRALEAANARIEMQATVIERLTEQLKAAELRLRDERMAARKAESLLEPAEKKGSKK